MLTGDGNIQTVGCQLPAGQVVRVVDGSTEAPDALVGCAEAAEQAGDRVELVIQWDAALTLRQTVRRFRQAVDAYPNVWAVAVGNEQELPEPQAMSPVSYARVWRAVEPVVARSDPAAVRVAGEISPWGLKWFAQAAAIGLPGVQAFSAHPYPDSGSPWAANPAPFVRLAARYHVQAWATEGMCGPESWMRYGCLPAATLASDGFSVGVEWYASTV